MPGYFFARHERHQRAGTGRRSETPKMISENVAIFLVGLLAPSSPPSCRGRRASTIRTSFLNISTVIDGLRSESAGRASSAASSGSLGMSLKASSNACLSASSSGSILPSPSSSNGIGDRLAVLVFGLGGRGHLVMLRGGRDGLVMLGRGRPRDALVPRPSPRGALAPRRSPRGARGGSAAEPRGALAPRIPRHCQLKAASPWPKRGPFPPTRSR